MGSLRVAFLASEYPPHVYGGLGTHVHALTTALAARGTRIELFVPRREGYDPPPPGVELHHVAAGRASSNEQFWLQFCRRATAMVRQRGGAIDLIHSHDWMTVLAGIPLRRLLNAPLIYSVHLPQVTAPHRPIENLGLVWADCVLVNSRAVTEEIARRGLPISSMRVIPNGVDPDSFVPADASRADPYVLYVGRLVAQKGVDVALHAFGILLRRCPATRLVVVGDGDQALYLKRVVRYLGIAPRVAFVGWQRGQSLVNLYQQAAVVVVPSLYEPFGMVALEAMACGRPVVASSTGGLAEVVEHDVTGYLVRPGDHLELAQRLAALLLDPARAARLGAAGRRRACDFDWESIAARTERVYESLVHQELVPRQRQSPGLSGDFVSAVGPALQPLAKGLVAEFEPQGWV